MKIYVDISVHTDSGVAVGVVSGYLNFEHIPRIGELISFSQPILKISNIEIPNTVNMQFKIEHIIHAPGLHSVLSIGMKNVVLKSVNEAKNFMRYLENGFGLFADYFIEE